MFFFYKNYDLFLIRVAGKLEIMMKINAQRISCKKKKKTRKEKKYDTRTTITVVSNVVTH